MVIRAIWQYRLPICLVAMRCTQNPKSSRQQIRRRPAPLGRSTPSAFGGQPVEDFLRQTAEFDPAVGIGPLMPVASKLSEEGRALNRRVAFVLLK
jgi:hypothetical protein